MGKEEVLRRIRFDVKQGSSDCYLEIAFNKDGTMTSFFEDREDAYGDYYFVFHRLIIDWSQRKLTLMDDSGKEEEYTIKV